MQGFGDFDFLVGEWRITNERLRERLKGSTDWEIFPATSKVEKVMRAPDGTFGGISTRCSSRKKPSPA